MKTTTVALAIITIMSAMAMGCNGIRRGWITSATIRALPLCEEPNIPDWEAYPQPFGPTLWRWDVYCGGQEYRCAGETRAVPSSSPVGQTSMEATCEMTGE